MIDHRDHVHLRIDESAASNWVQVSATLRQLLQVLIEEAIPYVIHRQNRHVDNTSLGCCEDMLDALHHETVGANGAECSSPDDDPCAVCFECFNPDDAVVVLPCSHRYHAGCIKPWLRRANSCPTCRTALTRTSVGLPEEPSASREVPQVSTTLPMLQHAIIATSPRESRRTPPARKLPAIHRLGSWVVQSFARHSAQDNTERHDGAATTSTTSTWLPQLDRRRPPARSLRHLPWSLMNPVVTE